MDCEERIDMEIVVDAYDEFERWSGWHCYLEDKLKFPSQAKCIKVRDMSPLKKGEVVEVIGMVDHETENLPEMCVKIRWQNRTLGVPLEQLEGIKVNPGNKTSHRRLALLVCPGLHVLILFHEHLSHSEA